MRPSGAAAGVYMALAAAACNDREPGPVAEGEVVNGQLGGALDEFLHDAVSEGFPVTCSWQETRRVVDW